MRAEPGAYPIGVETKVALHPMGVDWRKMRLYPIYQNNDWSGGKVSI